MNDINITLLYTGNSYTYAYAPTYVCMCDKNDDGNVCGNSGTSGYASDCMSMHVCVCVSVCVSVLAC